MISSKAILRNDVAGRVPRIVQVWPFFSDEVVKCFRRIWDGSDLHKKRLVNRMKHFVEQDETIRVSADFLGWEKEVFEVAFQEALQGLSAYLRATLSEGQVDECQVLLDALPSLKWMLFHELNRIPRPDLIRPSQAAAGIRPISVLNGASQYSGWYRLGAWEDELVDTASSPILTAIGVVATLQGDRPTGKKPTLVINEERLVDQGSHLPSSVEEISELCGPLVVACRLRNLLGNDDPLLLPTPDLIDLCLLSCDPWPMPLTYRRTDGTPWLRFRTWRADSRKTGQDGTAYRLV